MKKGDFVKVRAYGGKILTRRVVAVDEERCVVFVATDEEYRQAEEEGREPRCIGFPLWDVVEE